MERQTPCITQYARAVTRACAHALCRTLWPGWNPTSRSFRTGLTISSVSETIQCFTGDWVFRETHFCGADFFCFFCSSDTWEYELSHVLDLCTEDFVRKCILALTSWKDISQNDKMKALQLLLSFITANIASIGPHCLLGVGPTMHLHFRNCQRAGWNPLITHVQHRFIQPTNAQHSCHGQHERIAQA